MTDPRPQPCCQCATLPSWWVDRSRRLLPAPLWFQTWAQFPETACHLNTNVDINSQYTANSCKTENNRHRNCVSTWSAGIWAHVGCVGSKIQRVISHRAIRLDWKLTHFVVISWFKFMEGIFHGGPHAHVNTSSVHISGILMITIHSLSYWSHGRHRWGKNRLIDRLRARVWDLKLINELLSAAQTVLQSLQLPLRHFEAHFESLVLLFLVQQLLLSLIKHKNHFSQKSIDCCGHGSLNCRSETCFQRGYSHATLRSCIHRLVCFPIITRLHGAPIYDGLFTVAAGDRAATASWWRGIHITCITASPGSHD